MKKIDPMEVKRRKTDTFAEHIDFDVLLDGDSWELVEGEDFFCKEASLRSAVEKEAAVRGRSFTINHSVRNNPVITGRPRDEK